MANRRVYKQKTGYSPFLNIALALCVIFVVTVSIFKLTEFIISSKQPSFPKLEISLGYVTIEEIALGSKDVKYPGNQLSLTTIDSSLSLQNVEVKGRGNHTWNQPKRPYQINLNSSTSLFGLPPARKWILLADYLDRTHLRNNIAFYLSDLINSSFAPHGHYIELYFDNSYQGLYYLTEKIEVKKSRLHLKDASGILVELDDSYGAIDECKYDDKKNCLILKDAVNDDLSSAALQDLIESLNRLHAALQEKNYSIVSSIIDIDSFAKYYILNEFTNNPDAYSTSFFMYKDGLADQIHAGPIWDFDIALGNDYLHYINGSDASISLSPTEDTPFKQFSANPDVGSSDSIKSTAIVYNLLDFPEFRARVSHIYQETMSGKKSELLDYIKNQANYIRDAALRDQARWKLKTNFDEEVDYLLDWVSKRFDHFEATYGLDGNFDLETQIPEISETEKSPETEENSIPSGLNPTPESLPPSTESPYPLE